MVSYRDLLPEPDELLFIAGQRGSGKTYLTRKLLELLPEDEPVFIIDSKHTWPIRKKWSWDKEEKKKARLLEKTGKFTLNNLEPGEYVLRPDYPEISDNRVTDLLLYALHKGDCTVDIDELGDLSRGGNVLPSLGKLIRQGREPKVRMFIGSQRPSAIPLIAITESTRVACFRLKSLDDRKRMAQWVSPELINPVRGHDFYYVNDREDKIFLIRSTK